jgi:hypothetical protein
MDIMLGYKNKRDKANVRAYGDTDASFSVEVLFKTYSLIKAYQILMREATGSLSNLQSRQCKKNGWHTSPAVFLFKSPAGGFWGTLPCSAHVFFA